MCLTTSQIETISKQVYRQFPEVQNTRPAVQSQSGAKAVAASGDHFVLTFKGLGQGPGGKSIARIVRVVADERGKILKMSTSR
jgi:hypothetical protein